METQLCRSAEQFARPRPRARWGPVRMPRHHLGAASAAGRAVPGGSRAPPPPWDRGDECPPPAGNSRKTGAGVQTPGVARLGALPWRAGAGLLSRGQTGRCPRSVENKETCVQRWLLTGARPVTGGTAAQGVSQGLSRAASRRTGLLPQADGRRAAGAARISAQGTETRGVGEPPHGTGRHAGERPEVRGSLGLTERWLPGCAIASAASHRLKVRTGTGARGAAGRGPQPEAALHPL